MSKAEQRATLDTGLAKAGLSKKAAEQVAKQIMQGVPEGKQITMADVEVPASLIVNKEEAPPSSFLETAEMSDAQLNEMLDEMTDEQLEELANGNEVSEEHVVTDETTDEKTDETTDEKTDEKTVVKTDAKTTATAKTAAEIECDKQGGTMQSTGGVPPQMICIKVHVKINNGGAGLGAGGQPVKVHANIHVKQ